MSANILQCKFKCVSIFFSWIFRLISLYEEICYIKDNDERTTTNFVHTDFKKIKKGASSGYKHHTCY